MPTLSLVTNVPLSPPSATAVCKKLSAVVAKSTGKPESYVTVSLRADVPLVFGGTEAPAAQAELLSIGALGKDRNKAHSRALADVLLAELGVPADRFYCKFTDVAASDMGWNGSTF